MRVFSLIMIVNIKLNEGMADASIEDKVGEPID